MYSRTYITYLKTKVTEEMPYFNIPVECIRKARSLNIDKASRWVSSQIYRILKSENARKIFTPPHRFQ